MSMNGKIKVRYINENAKGLIKNRIYDGYKIKSAVPNKDDIISVVDQFGEEYAYPKNWFEIIEE